ncbi:MAG: DsbA family protein [Sulfuricaulis sp.]
MAFLTVNGGRQNRTRALQRGLLGSVAFIVAALWLGACASPALSTSSSKTTVATGASPGNPKPPGGAQPDGTAPVADVAAPRTSLAGAYRLGNSDAKIGIVEFSDFQCPYCGAFHEQEFFQLKKAYIDSGIIQYIHKDLPLSMIHAQALPAALAANCAGAQGQFWEMNDALYAHQRELSRTLYIELARGLNLDAKKFTDCLKSPASLSSIRQDAADAQRLGINGTPSFLLGKIVGDTLTIEGMAQGAPSFQVFAQEIEKLRQPAEPRAPLSVK